MHLVLGEQSQVRFFLACQCLTLEKFMGESHACPFWFASLYQLKCNWTQNGRRAPSVALEVRSGCSLFTWVERRDSILQLWVLDFNSHPLDAQLQTHFSQMSWGSNHPNPSLVLLETIRNQLEWTWKPVPRIHAQLSFSGNHRQST